MPRTTIACLVLLAASPALAEGPAGIWNITQTRSPDGKKYEGVVNVKPVNEDVLLLAWQTSAGEYGGLGFHKAGRLFAGYGPGTEFGVAIYKIGKDGTLVGKVARPEALESGIGTEEAAGGTKGKLEGTYTLTGTEPGGAGAYTGRLTVEKVGQRFEVTWRKGDETVGGVGMRAGDHFVAAWGKGCGVVVYELKDGNARGQWAMAGEQTGLGVENLKRNDAK
jgi:hypothetical protein